MTDTEIKLREMEERIKKLEDAVFNTWFNQYQPVGQPYCDFEHNYGYYGPFDGHNNVNYQYNPDNETLVKVNHD